MYEEWKPVKGYEGFYEASTMGRIRSVTRYINRSRGGLQMSRGMVLRQNHNGSYYSVGISKYGKQKTVAVHKMVMEAFSQRPVWAEEINHINHNSLDNHLSNLEWCTVLQNRDHTYKDGNSKRARPVQRLNDGKVYRSMCEAAKDISATQSQIDKVCNGKMRQTHGYSFRFLNQMEV